MVPEITIYSIKNKFYWAKSAGIFCDISGNTQLYTHDFWLTSPTIMKASKYKLNQICFKILFNVSAKQNCFDGFRGSSIFVHTAVSFMCCEEQDYFQKAKICSFKFWQNLFSWISKSHSPGNHFPGYLSHKCLSAW